MQGFEGTFFIPPDRGHGLEFGNLGSIDISMVYFGKFIIHRKNK
jgi:hypothetical protein